MTKFFTYTARWLQNSIVALFGRADSLCSGYYTLLLLRIALYLLLSVKRHKRPQTRMLLHDIGSALVCIAVANITGNALQLPTLRFLTFTYYILHEADCILTMLEETRHKLPPEVSNLIGHRRKRHNHSKKEQN